MAKAMWTAAGGRQRRNSIVKIVGLLIAGLIAAPAVFTTPAQAWDGYYRPYYGYRHDYYAPRYSYRGYYRPRYDYGGYRGYYGYRHDYYGPRYSDYGYRRYYEPRYRYYAPRYEYSDDYPRYYRPAYYSGYYNDRPYGSVGYCLERFQSYDPRSGTYIGYDGFVHTCP